MDQVFLVKLFIVIGIIWLVDKFMDMLAVKPTPKVVIEFIVLLVGVAWIVAPVVLPMLK